MDAFGLEPSWWPILCLVRSAVPAAKVIGHLQLLSPVVVNGSDPDGPSTDPLDERGQRAFLTLISADPVLSVLGLRPAYRQNLLKRLLVTAEARKLEVADELADEYAQALAGGQTEPSREAGTDGQHQGSTTDWLFKTFAYGPAAASEDHSGPGTQPSPSPPPPVPQDVTARHVAALAAALKTGRHDVCLGATQWNPADGEASQGVRPQAASPSGPSKPSERQCPESPESNLAPEGGCLHNDDDGAGSSSTSAAGAAAAASRGARPAAAAAVGLAEEQARQGIHAAEGTATSRGASLSGQPGLPSARHEADSGPGVDSSCAGPEDGPSAFVCTAPRTASQPAAAAASLGTAAAEAAAAAAASGAGGAGPAAGLVTLRVSDNLLAGSTGCHEWEASFALAQWVLGHPEVFAGRRVLELGCGAGLVAVALRRAGAALVAATDGSDAAVRNCAFNLRLNGLGCEVVEAEAATELAELPGGVAVCPLMWDEPLPAGGLRCDVVVASDVLYDPEVVPVLVSLLRRLLSAPPQAPAGAVDAPTAAPARKAYIASLRRNPATMELFLRRARESGLRVEAVDCWQHTVRFHHVPALEDPDTVGRILLHRVTLLDVAAEEP